MKNRKNKFQAGLSFIFLLMLVANATKVQAATIYVPADYSTIQNAINAAVDGDMVSVAPGTYNESITMKAGVDVIGAGLGTTTIQSLLVVVTGAGDATIQGFTITGGDVGIFADNVSDFKVLNNMITDINNPVAHGGAKGIHIINSNDIHIYHNTIKNISDVLWNGAYGIFLDTDVSVTIYDNMIHDISDSDWDPAFGVYSNYSAETVIYSNRIYNIGDHEWSHGAAIYDVNATSSTIVGNIIHDIEDTHWDNAYGIHESGTAANISYNTIVYISEDLWDYAYGIYNYGSTSTISHNIVAHVSNADWGDAYGIYNTDNPVDTTYSDVMCNDVWDVTGSGPFSGAGIDYFNDGNPLGPDNLTVDPLFVDEAAKDFHLQSTSPLLSLCGGEIGAYGAPCLVGCEVPVDIDIKPDSLLNSVNLKSSGVVPVAIFSSDDFDALTLNPQTLTLAGAPVKVVGKKGKYLCHEDDVDEDGLVDLLCKFLVEEMTLAVSDTSAVLKGETYDNDPVIGEDSIRIVPPMK